MNDLTTTDAEARVMALIALTEDLKSIFEQENTVLKNRRPGDLAPLQRDKARLASAYAQSIREIARDRGLVAGAGGALIDHLRELTRTFERRATEQRALLDGGLRAAEGVVAAIASEATKRPSYGAASSPPAPIILSKEA